MMQRLTVEDITSVLHGKTVGIAGCGGLGSNCAAALARSGVGKLILVDYDIISEGNLNRQFYFYHQIGLKKAPVLKENILLIKPDVSIHALDMKLTSENIPEIFGKCDVVVEAFDQASEKQMLIEVMLGHFPLLPVVSGLGMAGFGDNDSIHYRQWGNLHICGDEVSEIAPDLPPLAPRVGIVAHMQANTVLEILLNTNPR